MAIFMAYVITSNLTYSSQAFRDAARTRIDAVIAAHNVLNRATIFPGGVTNPTTTTIAISIETAINDASVSGTLAREIYDAATSSNRHSSGWISVNKI